MDSTAQGATLILPQARSPPAVGGRGRGSDRRRPAGRIPPRSAAGRPRRGVGRARGRRGPGGGPPTRPRGRSAGRAGHRAPSWSRSVLPPMAEARQGSAVAIASRSELLIPSATLGSTKASAARSRAAGSSTAPRKWTRSATPSARAEFGEPVALRALADQDQRGPGPAGDLRPGVEEDVEVLLRVEPAREDHARPRREAGLVQRIGAGAEVVGVDPAGHADHPPGGDAEGQPLPLDVGGDRREGPVAQDRPAEDREASRAGQLLGLAEIPRAGRLDQDRGAPKPRRPRPVAMASQSPWWVWIRSYSGRSRRRARMTPATKLTAKRGPSRIGSTQRWTRTPCIVLVARAGRGPPASRRARNGRAGRAPPLAPAPSSCATARATGSEP